ncbi:MULTISPECIES: hypothetical protein [Streptomycetaceae]|uniref:hypothetical protein n=1 Tax=Streptomycetaceae TaxID=2062 RepID=UPI001160E978|nr:hypothetical protein [Streptomyces sp. CB02056]
MAASTVPEATAWFAAEAVTSVEELTKALSSPWALHTPEQAGAVAAALVSIEHHVAQAKGRLPSWRSWTTSSPAGWTPSAPAGSSLASVRAI